MKLKTLIRMLKMLKIRQIVLVPKKIVFFNLKPGILTYEQTFVFTNNSINSDDIKHVYSTDFQQH